jgi:hypothetical protein
MQVMSFGKRASFWKMHDFLENAQVLEKNNFLRTVQYSRR